VPDVHEQHERSGEQQAAADDGERGTMGRPPAAILVHRMLLVGFGGAV
jgi:hypothetical protein